MKYQLITVLIALILFGCKTEADNSNSKDTTTAEMKVEDQRSELDDITDETDIDLEIVDFEGLKPYLSRQDDKVYVINFWATWCAPCVKELPHFEKLNEEMSGKNFEVILVSLDFPTKYETNLKPYIKKHNLKSKIIALNDVDSNSWIPQISEEWSGALPATLIYKNSDKTFYEGSYDYEGLQKAVKPYLNL